MKSFLFTIALVIYSFTFVFAQDSLFTRREVIYDRKDGLALTLTVLTPTKQNGKAIISMLSGGWVSAQEWIPDMIKRANPFLLKGYTVFLVGHGSAPRYAIDDAVYDVQRSIQFIRFNASTYGIDPARIGITGTSSGGHLSLMAGVSNDIADPKSKEPMARVSSRVQAVAAFCPPADFLNWGSAGANTVNQQAFLLQADVVGAFEFKTFNKSKRTFEIIKDSAGLMKISREMSPAQLVTKDDAPIYLMHGDSDHVVPLQQSQLMQRNLQAAGVPVKLTVKKGAGHGWRTMVADEQEFVDWFDEYLFAPTGKSIPWLDKPQAIPGFIQGELYDTGGEGVAWHDTDSLNNGSGKLNPANGMTLNEFRMKDDADISYTKKDGVDDNPYNKVKPKMGSLYLGWTVPGEWVRYTVDVRETGTYRVGILYTANGDGAISLQVDDQPEGELLKIPTTHDDRDTVAWRQWHHWNRIDKLGSLQLTKGPHIITLRIERNGNMNLDQLEFRKE